MAQMNLSMARRCGIDGSLMSPILDTTTFTLYTCHATAHTLRVGTPAPLQAEKPPTQCSVSDCPKRRAPGAAICITHLNHQRKMASRARSRRRA